MIKTNELRVGNLVYTPMDFKMKVVGIFDDQILLDFEGNEGDVFDFKPNELKPIPLTEEKLLKFGFENIYDELLFYNGYCDLIFNDNRVSLRVEGQWLSFDVEYVHQLQNLYFALKGIELQYVA